MCSGFVAAIAALLTLFILGCSKPEEVIASRIALANKNLEADKAGEAIAILEKLDRAHPEQPPVLEALGFAYAQAGRHRPAATSFARAADKDEGFTRLRKLAAEAFLRDGAANLAAEQHRLYVGRFPDDYQSWQMLGEIEEQQGNLLQAIDAYINWFRVKPSGECAFRLGSAFRQLNNSPQAKNWFETTIRQGEDHVQEALLALLGLEIEAADLAAAERSVGQLDRNFPGSLDASPLAGVRARLAAWKEAEQALADARAEQERLTGELEQTRLRQQEELARARASVAAPTVAHQEPAARAEPPAVSPSESPPAGASPAGPAPAEVPAPAPAAANLSPELAAALARREAGQTDKAVDILWRALGSDDSQVDLWVELADCYRELGQSSPAEACILEARRRAPDSIEIETSYLNIVRGSQPREVYFKRVEEARRRFPANANLAYVFARELAGAAGDPSRAIVAYEDFLFLSDPADPRRSEASAFIARARQR